MTGKDATRLLREMIRIRTAEETVAVLYRQQEMRTPTHLSIGQEAVPVGICQALGRTDVAYSGHRCHAEYLAKGGSLLGMFAELYGRVDGCCKGRGGSVHLYDREAGLVASSAILGETIATAVGSAWAFKMDGQPRVSVTFLGDGVTEEGVFTESLNFAAVLGVPVIFACANNGMSTYSPLSVRQPKGIEIWRKAEAFGVTSAHVDGNDVFAVHALALEAAEHCRSGRGPFFIEASTFRAREHVGPYTDAEQNYKFSYSRPREYVEAGLANDPIVLATRKLIADGACTEVEVEGWKAEARREVDAAVAAAQASPFPSVDELLVGAY
jgi:pyruvate dehydrogenase E1 component alpha subunit